MAEILPYDVDPVLIPAGESFFQTNRVTFFGTKGDCWAVTPGPTDFASVPRVGVWLIPKFGRWTAAAILHDWFCRFAITAGIISPRDADAVFRSVMRRDGVPPLLRNIAWAGVRWGAAANPIRRHEWWRDFPRLMAVSVVALPIMLLAAVGIVIGLGLYHFVEAAVTLFVRDEAHPGAGMST